MLVIPRNHLDSERHWDLEKVCAMRRCPLYRGLTIFSKEMTFTSLTQRKECKRELMEMFFVCYILQPRKSS